MTRQITQPYEADEAPETSTLEQRDRAENPIEHPCRHCGHPRSAIVHRTHGHTCAECCAMFLARIMVRLTQTTLERNARRYPSRAPNESLPYKDD